MLFSSSESYSGAACASVRCRDEGGPEGSIALFVGLLWLIKYQKPPTSTSTRTNLRKIMATLSVQNRISTGCLLGRGQCGVSPSILASPEWLLSRNRTAILCGEKADPSLRSG